MGEEKPKPSRLGRGVYLLLVWSLIGILAWGGWDLVKLLRPVRASDWLEILRDTGFSFIRVFAAVLIGTIWTVPLGVWIGLNPKLSNRLQPFIQFAASFPSPMLYPWLVAFILFLHGTLQTGSVLLILFGTQWYILFNVAGAAAAIPNDIISCSEVLHLSGWNRWVKFLLFPQFFRGSSPAGSPLRAASLECDDRFFARLFRSARIPMSQPAFGAYIKQRQQR